MRSLATEFLRARRGWKSPFFKFKITRRKPKRRQDNNDNSDEPRQENDGYEWSYHNRMMYYDTNMMDGERILPLPKMQIGATCNHHACVACFESQSRIWYGQSRLERFPALSIQHAIDSVNSIKTKHVLKWLERHGVTTEQHYPYKGERGQNKYKKKSGWPLYKLGKYKFLDARNISNHLVTWLNLRIKSDGPILGRFTVRKDYRSCSSLELYRGLGPIRKNPLTGGEYTHLVTVTGSGIENNEKYWTYMNSYGLDWGREGKGKIASNAIDCFYLPHLKKIEE